MRKLRPWLVLLLALSSGGLAAYLALQYLRQQAAPVIVADSRKGRVVLATRDLPLGHVLSEEDVKSVSWPGDAVPQGYLGSTELAVGRGVIVPLHENEPLLDTKLASKDAGGGLAIAVSEGMRAVSVRVDDVISVAGFVGPGTRVDVLLTLSPPGNDADPTTKVILQNVQTLAAGQSVQKDREGRAQTVTVITVLVTPEQAEALALASNQGRIQLALRNTLDTLTVRTAGVRASGLLGPRLGQGGAPPAGPRTPRPTAPTRVSTETIIEGYNGGVRTLLKF
jgi:pilus assembly protein CpaB